VESGAQHPGQRRRLTAHQFAGGQRVRDQPPRFPFDELGVGDRMPPEVGVGQIDLQKGEAVRDLFRRPHELGPAVAKGEERLGRRWVRLADGRELLPVPFRAGGGEREQQAALGAEALDERGRRDPAFAGDIGERQADRPEPTDGAGGGAEKRGVGRLARTRAHGPGL
jgi:hypothetical protein